MTIVRQLGQALLVLGLLGCVVRLLAVMIGDHRPGPSDGDPAPTSQHRGRHGRHETDPWRWLPDARMEVKHQL